MKAAFEVQNQYEEIQMDICILSDLHALAHWHVDVELVYVIEGAVQMGINEEQRVLQAGDIGICCSNDIHFFSSEISNSVILIKCLPEYIDGYGTWQKNHIFNSPFIEAKSVGQPGGLDRDVYDNMKALFHSLFREMNDHRDFYKLFAKSKLLELCGLMLRHLPKQECETKREQSDSSIKLVQESLRYIEKNVMNNPSLEEIARTMNISPYYFSRIFNKVIGMNLKAYQNMLRLNKAENMIVCDKAPITDIAYQCGFNSIRTFNRCFRLVKGYSPSDLRKPAIAAAVSQH
ncbi:AraC family transcriptional regulator [Paenibacillus humicola]|uniref:AraC family transcriptional regulator n=1 Tax=Paenibacillus humicola TaxID=3110540 RepID=UPI00237AD062|nr:AraC family transcriptional regulator [Paenibacillus humicola]